MVEKEINNMRDFKLLEGKILIVCKKDIIITGKKVSAGSRWEMHRYNNTPQKVRSAFDRAYVDVINNSNYVLRENRDGLPAIHHSKVQSLFVAKTVFDGHFEEEKC